VDRRNPASDPIALVVAAWCAVLGGSPAQIENAADIAIETMRQTGNDMSDRYKETSAGLAVNVVECWWLPVSGPNTS
jgi:L-serine deaminase